VLALEAGAVEDDAVGGELVHRVHRLGAHLALLLRPAKHPRPDPPSSYSLGCRAAAKRARSESAPRSGLGLRARERGGNGENEEHLRPAAPAAEDRYAGGEAQLSNGIMTGSSPTLPQLARPAPHFCRGGKEKPAMGWLLLIKLVRNYERHH